MMAELGCSSIGAPPARSATSGAAGSSPMAACPQRAAPRPSQPPNAPEGECRGAAEIFGHDRCRRRSGRRHRRPGPLQRRRRRVRHPAGRRPAATAAPRVPSTVTTIGGAGDAHPRRPLGTAGRGLPWCTRGPRAPSALPSDPVAEPERQIVHRAGRRNADVPVADSAGPVLDRRQHAGAEHLEVVVISDGSVMTIRTGRRVEAVARVVDLRAVRDQHERVDLGAQRHASCPARRVRRRSRVCRRLRRARS